MPKSSRWEVFDKISGNVERRSRSERAAIEHQQYLVENEWRYRQNNPDRPVFDWSVREAIEIQ